MREEFDPASPERLRQSAEILRTDGVKGLPIAYWHSESAAAAADRIEELERELANVCPLCKAARGEQEEG